MAGRLDGSSLPVVAGRALSLGEVIDGYLHLSPMEKTAFLNAVGLAGIQQTPVAVAAPVAVATTSAVKAVPAVVPAGSTMDPKTGKVFKLVPKKEHSAERSQLEAAKEAARLALVQVSDAHGIYRAVEGPRRYDGERDGLHLSAEMSAEYNAAVAAYDAAKAALTQYKTANPGEFQAPTAKRGGSHGIRGNRGGVRGRGIPRGARGT